MENSSTTKKPEPKKLKHFVDSRSSDQIFKDSLSKDRENTRAKCTVCYKVIELSSDGRLYINYSTLTLTTVEQGFSNSNNLVRTIMNSGPVIVKRLVKVHVLFHQLKLHTIQITSSMIKAFRGPHMNYRKPLDQSEKKH